MVKLSVKIVSMQDADKFNKTCSKFDREHFAKWFCKEHKWEQITVMMKEGLQ